MEMDEPNHQEMGSTQTERSSGQSRVKEELKSPLGCSIFNIAVALEFLFQNQV